MLYLDVQRFNVIFLGKKNQKLSQAQGEEDDDDNDDTGGGGGRAPSNRTYSTGRPRHGWTGGGQFTSLPPSTPSICRSTQLAIAPTPGSYYQEQLQVRGRCRRLPAASHQSKVLQRERLIALGVMRCAHGISAPVCLSLAMAGWRSLSLICAQGGTDVFMLPAHLACQCLHYSNGPMHHGTLINQLSILVH